MKMIFNILIATYFSVLAFYGYLYWRLSTGKVKFYKFLDLEVKTHDIEYLGSMALLGLPSIFLAIISKFV